MICPQCKNEKWDQETCPDCGLGEKEALLNQAEIFKKEGNLLTALGFYEKYLFLDPGNFEVLSQRAVCLCQEAVSRGEIPLFQKADEALISVFQTSWTWERGHQTRVDLYYNFGKLEELLNEYENISLEKDFRYSISQKMIKIINLTRKFKETPPAVLTTVKGDNQTIYIKSFWPLFIGVPILLWGAYEIAALPHSREGGNVVILFFVFLFIALSIIVLIYLCTRLYKKNQNEIKKENKFAEKD